MNKIYLTENDLYTLVENCVNRILYEERNLVDNFDRVAKLMKFNSPDDFYFVQIIKRNKDNPHLKGNKMSQSQKEKENFSGGSWYRKGYRIRSVDDLMRYKQEIIDYCNRDNARAYITINSRSEQQTNDFIPIYIRQISDKYFKEKKRPIRANDPRILHAHEIVPGKDRNGPSWRNTRKRFFMDIDTAEKDVWKKVIDIFGKHGIQPIDSYTTPSGGLHVIFPDKYDYRVGLALEELTMEYNNGEKFKPDSIMLPEFDKKIILYSNVETKGYKK